MNPISNSQPLTRLVLIEGIPGSGKTTTARFAAEWLTQNGVEPALFLEGNWDHPADYESTACLDEDQYAGLQAQFPELREFLDQQVRWEGGERFLCYPEIQQTYGHSLPDGLMEALAQYEIYDLPVEKHVRLLRERWQNFADRATQEKRTYIFECCFLQNPFTTLLARHNLPLAAVRRHILDLAEMLQSLRPRLIYLAQSDPRATLERVRSERPPEWADYVTGYITGGAYGKAHGLSGFSGTAEFYAERQALELELIRALPFPAAILSDLTPWEARYEAAKFFLSAA